MGKAIAKKMILCVIVLLSVLALSTLYLYTKDYSDHFADRRGNFSHASLTPVGDSLNEKSWLTIYNTDGFSVNCGILVPRGKGGRYPAIILLGGKATGKNAIDYAIGVDGCIIVAVDYAYDPRDEYSLINIIADVPAVREALLDVVPSAMLVSDYLRTRDDVDTTRIVMLGYSFGAPFVPCIVTHDRRYAVAAMVYGAGGLHSLIRHNVNRYRGELMSEFVGVLGGVLLRPLEPMQYVDQISPTSLLMINGTYDEQIPEENVTALFAKAREPKKIVWIASKHVRVDDAALTMRIISTLQHELRSLGVLPSE